MMCTLKSVFDLIEPVEIITPSRHNRIDITCDEEMKKKGKYAHRHTHNAQTLPTNLIYDVLPCHRRRRHTGETGRGNFLITL